MKNVKEKLINQKGNDIRNMNKKVKFIIKKILNYCTAVCLLQLILETNDQGQNIIWNQIFFFWFF